MRGCDLRNLVQPCLLLLLLERPGHGYDLIERLAAMGFEDVDPGHVYRVLRSLEAEGLVRSAWVTRDTGPARRSYELTTTGLRDLNRWASQLAHLQPALAGLLARWAHVSQSAASVAPSNSTSRSDGDGHRRRPAGRGPRTLTPADAALPRQHQLRAAADRARLRPL